MSSPCVQVCVSVFEWRLCASEIADWDNDTLQWSYNGQTRSNDTFCVTDHQTINGLVLVARYLRHITFSTFSFRLWKLPAISFFMIIVPSSYCYRFLLNYYLVFGIYYSSIGEALCRAYAQSISKIRQLSLYEYNNCCHLNWNRRVWLFRWLLFLARSFR